MHIGPEKPLLSKSVTIAFTFGRLTSRDRVRSSYVKEFV
jgi:hypothetical protein